MPKIVLISSSVRLSRNSHRVAQFFNNFIVQNALGTVEILDLNECQFPIFEERLKYMTNPSPAIIKAAQTIKAADGIIIVTPEYNGGYPASLKNFTDLLYDEWKKKPIAIATVSDGNFGGTQVITSLVFTLWKIGAWVVPAMFPVPNVKESYNEEGVPANADSTHKRAKHFIDELLWCIKAKELMAITP